MSSAISPVCSLLRTRVGQRLRAASALLFHQRGNSELSTSGIAPVMLLHPVRHYSGSSSSASTAVPAPSVVGGTGSESHDLLSSTAPLAICQAYIQKRDYQGCVGYYENHFNPSAHHFLHDFCQGYLADARDTILLLMRCYTSLGRIDKVRGVLAVALRDMAAEERETGASPLQYAALTSGAAAAAAAGGGGGGGSAQQPSLELHHEPLLPTPVEPSYSSAAHLDKNHPHGAKGEPDTLPFRWSRPSMLCPSIFNAYLEALTRRTKFDAEEVVFLLQEMKAAAVAPNALTYHYLIELQIRAGYDPSALWSEMTREHHLRPLPVTVQTLFLRVLPYSTDAVFVVDVAKAAMSCGSAFLDKRMISELMEQWLKASSPSHANHASTTAAPRYPPEYILWLLLELELRCVMDQSSLAQYAQRQHFAELLLHCARCADAGTAHQVLALMDRHAIPKTADILALMIWCLAQALEVEKALDLTEWVALKGYLEQTDLLRKTQIECLRFTMDRHYLMAVVEALSTAALIERATAHLRQRQRQGLLVTVHTLDLIVFAWARVGEERRALELVSSYEERWGATPQTQTLNGLLMGSSASRSTMLHRAVYESMVVSAGVAPNAFTFRILIRQAVSVGDIDEAIYYLEQVTKYTGLRVEVEMVLPILERAARVGDVETANRISQYALNCDIGIDGVVLRAILQHLTEAGQNVDVLKTHLPLHEALRSRSKVGRQRVRHEVLV